MSTFKQGDMVELLSGHYPEDSTNPLRTKGVITGVRDGHEHCYAVKWDNGNNNSYRPHELKAYLMPDIKAKVGDLIRIHRDNGAYWVKAGTNYVVQAIDPMTTRIKVMNQWWACDNDDYTILSSQAGESTTETTIEKYKKQVQKEALLKEAKELYPPGTTFKNRHDSISTVSDSPDYTVSSSDKGVYVRTETGKLVYIYYENQWAEIVDRTFGPAIVTTPKSHFDVGDVVEVTERTEFFNVGHVSTVERADGTTVLMANHKGDSWFINNTKVKHHTVPTRKITLDLPTLSKEELTGLQEYFYPQTKTNTNGTESSKQSVKLQGINLKIREGNSVRGIGLKGSGSKIKLGSDYSYN